MAAGDAIELAGATVHAAMKEARKVVDYSLASGEEPDPVALALYTRAIVDVYLANRG